MGRRRKVFAPQSTNLDGWIQLKKAMDIEDEQEKMDAVDVTETGEYPNVENPRTLKRTKGQMRYDKLKENPVKYQKHLEDQRIKHAEKKKDVDYAAKQLVKNAKWRVNRPSTPYTAKQQEYDRERRQDPVVKAKLIEYRNKPETKAKQAEYDRGRNKDVRNEQHRQREALSEKKSCKKCKTVFKWRSNYNYHCLLFHSDRSKLTNGLVKRWNPFSFKNTENRLISPLYSQEDEEQIDTYCERKIVLMLYKEFLESSKKNKYVYLVIILVNRELIHELQTCEEFFDFLHGDLDPSIVLHYYVGKTDRRGIASYHYHRPQDSTLAKKMKQGYRAFLVKLYKLSEGTKAENLKSSEGLEALIQLYGTSVHTDIKGRGAPFKLLNKKVEGENVFNHTTDEEINQIFRLVATNKPLICLKPNCSHNHNKIGYKWSANIQIDKLSVEEIDDLNDPMTALKFKRA